jgi:hypothetical protein
VVAVARDLKQVSATGDVTTGVPAILRSVTLTAAAATSTVIVKNGSSGSARLTLSAVANTSVVWTAGPEGVLFGTSIHATLSGASAVACFEFD